MRSIPSCTAAIAASLLALPARGQCLGLADSLTPPGVPFGFGTAVSIEGTRVLVGAGLDDTIAPDAGAAHVFEVQGSSWVHVAALFAADGAAGDQLGRAVALSGGTALVGAFRDDTAGLQAGSAYVFEEQGTAWVQVQELASSDASPGQRFGWSVAIDGDLAVVGAPVDDAHGLDAGVAYVFERAGSTWIETAELVASDAAGGEQFGQSVAVGDDRIVVGAWTGGDVPPAAGAVYVFERAGTAWVETARLTEPAPSAVSLFGNAVDLADNTIVVGARNDGFFAPNEPGTAYVFELQGTSWVATGTLLAPDGAPGDRFGAGVAVSGDRVLVRAPRDEDESGSGSAYLFERRPTGWTALAKIAGPADVVPKDGVALDGALGAIAATAVVDVVSTGPPCPSLSGLPGSIELATGGVQTLQLNAGADEASAVYVVLGTSAGTAPGIPLPGGVTLPLNPSSYLATTLDLGSTPIATAAGLLDSLGRGTATLALPAGLHPSLGGAVIDHAYLLFDPQTLQVTAASNAALLLLDEYPPQLVECAITADTFLTTSDPLASFSFANRMDVDGDTVLLGDFQALSPSGVKTGAAYVFERSGLTWTETAKLLASNGGPNHGFGSAVVVHEDTLAITAPGAGAKGRGYLFERQGTAWSEVAIVQPNDSPDDFGRSASLGDGTLLLGAEDAAYVFEGAGSGWTQTAKLGGSGAGPGDDFGREVALDGARALIGAPYAGASGAAYVFEQQGTAWVETAELVPSDAGVPVQFGAHVSLDGGRALVTSGSPGRAYVFELQGGSWFETARLDHPTGGVGPLHVSIEGSQALVFYFSETFVHEERAGGWTLAASLKLASGAQSTTLTGARSGDTVITGAGAVGGLGVHVFTGFTAGCQALLGKPPAVSVTTGGTQLLSIDAGPANALRTYLVLGTTAGTSPGLSLPGGLTLPLNLSDYLLATAAYPNALIAGSSGKLDPYGEAIASLTLPAGLDPSLVGATVHHACVVYEAGDPDIEFVTNATPWTLVP